MESNLLRAQDEKVEFSHHVANQTLWYFELQLKELKKLQKQNTGSQILKFLQEPSIVGNCTYHRR